MGGAALAAVLVLSACNASGPAPRVLAQACVDDKSGDVAETSHGKIPDRYTAVLDLVGVCLAKTEEALRVTYRHAGIPPTSLGNDEELPKPMDWWLSISSPTGTSLYGVSIHLQGSSFRVGATDIVRQAAISQSACPTPGCTFPSDVGSRLSEARIDLPNRVTVRDYELSIDIPLTKLRGLPPSFRWSASVKGEFFDPWSNDRLRLSDYAPDERRTEAGRPQWPFPEAWEQFPK
jgi:hypothetical protein